MRTKTTVLPSYGAQTTKYVWAAIATLIAALVLWGFMAAPRVFAIAGAADDKLLAENPELVYARAYSLDQNTATDLLAANPELIYARAYSLGQNTAGDLLAENPELVYARAYSLGQNTAGDLLAENPELIYARAYSLGQNTAGDLLAENPELVYAQAYSLGQSSGAAACILEKDYAAWAANPELMHLAQAQGC
jgi:hypothetical protein